jgi:hypothetical protein
MLWDENYLEVCCSGGEIGWGGEKWEICGRN